MSILLLQKQLPSAVVKRSLMLPFSTNASPPAVNPRFNSFETLANGLTHLKH